MKDLSLIKHRFFPSFYKHEAPRLVEFFGYYLEWMQMEGNPYWKIDKLQDFTNINESVDDYLIHLRNELMLDFPLTFASDTKYIMKNLVKLYQSKGTLDAFKFFFRSVYNSFCKISYPRELILRVSDGKWIQGYYIYTEDIPVGELTSLQGHVVIDKETGLTAIINDVVPHKFHDKMKYSLVIIDNKEKFGVGTKLTIEDKGIEFTITDEEYAEGYWDGTDGLLSSDKLLQDGYYYQNFSYEITSVVPFLDYKDIVLKLFHPAGMKLFGKFQLNEPILPTPKVPVSFIHWWIINIFLGVYAAEKNIESFNACIKIKEQGFDSFYTSDMQYLNKQYGIVNHVESVTPEQLYNITNDNNKIVFSNEKRIDVSWSNMTVPSGVNNYNIVGIKSKYPYIKMDIKNGVINILKNQNISSKIFIFVDGIKIPEDEIQKTANGFLLKNKNSGKCIIYSLDDFIKRKLMININNNVVLFNNSNLNRLLVFINGKFIWNNINYSNNEIHLPQSTGKLEIYELPNHDDYTIKYYHFKNNEECLLYTFYKNKNILY